MRCRFAGVDLNGAIVELVERAAGFGNHPFPGTGISLPAESTGGKLMLARLFAYGLRADRGLKGLKTGTPVGSKSDTFRVATVRPCSSAVAEMARSIPLLPIR